MEEHFDEIVDFAGVWDFLDVPLKNYSSGMQARIGFSIATMVRPDILIVDEILAVGRFQVSGEVQRAYDTDAVGGNDTSYGIPFHRGYPQNVYARSMD